MDSLGRDLRYALRLLWKDRSFAATTILTLAICLGANTAIFAVVRSVLLRPLPYPQAERLVFSYDGFPGAGVDRAGTSVPNYLDRQKEVTAFESLALYHFRDLAVGQAVSGEKVPGMGVTPSFFTVLATAAHRGRLFTEEEGVEGHEKVAILSYGYWQRAMGGRDNAVGSDLRINGDRYVVVGVMPQGFTFLNPDVGIWLPLAFNAEQRSEDARYSQNHEGLARLRPDATIAQAQQQVDAMTRRQLENAGPLKPLLAERGLSHHARPARSRTSCATCGGPFICCGAACCSCC